MSILDFAWLIPLIPLLAFAAIALFTHQNYGLSQQLATFGIMISSALAFALSFVAIFTISAGEQVPAPPPIRWFTISESTFPLGVHIDPLGVVMLAVLAPVCAIILIWNDDVWDDPGDSRMPALLSLLAASVLGLVIFDNLLIVLILWEIMDVGVYLLVGFRREREPALKGGLQAFLMAKVGSLCLLLGLVLLYAKTGSLSYVDVFSSAERLRALGQVDLFGAQLPAIEVIAVLFLAGAAIKGAQFPLHTWLFGATESPAPALALTHIAAAAAGPLLLIRALPLFEAATSLMILPFDMSVITLIGVLSAIFAALVVVTQRDLWRALSFAAAGQLGYVFVALGMGACTAGVFQLITSMFGNTLLLLTAGAVSRGMARASRKEASTGESVEANGVEANNMLHMGGIGQKRTGLFWGFFIGAVALTGLPLVTAGFWSKDAILLQAWEHNQTLFWILAAINGLTTFGAIRLVCLIFIGKPRTQAAERAPEHSPALSAPLVILVPIVLFLGWAGKQAPIAGGNWLASFLGTTDGIEFSLDPALYWSVLSVGGLTMSVLIYGWIPVRPGEIDPMEAALQRMRLGWLYRWTSNGFYIDRLYRWLSVTPSIMLSRLCDVLDRALARGLADSIAWIGKRVPAPFAWADTHILDALTDLPGRAVQVLSAASGWLDPRWNSLINLADPAVKYLAHASVILDRWLDEAVNLLRPGTLVLVKLSTHVDKGVDLVVNGVGRAVETGGLWFRPKTGHIQDYLRLTVVIILVLMVIFVFLFSQI